MTKTNFFLLVAGISTFSFMTMPINVNAVPPGYVLVEADEFNGTSLDTSLWIPAYLSCRTSEERAAARYSFKDSCLVLRIDQDQPTYYPDDRMKVSSIQTGQRDYLHKDRLDHHIPTTMKFTPQYGYFEIRAKLVNQTGYHCAFWTVGRRDESWQEAEIDIMEQYGNRAASNFNFIRWGDTNLSNTNQAKTLPFDPAEDFHLYALEWDSKSITYYVDNTVIRTINQSPNYPAVFFLGLYENAGWTGSADMTASKYPREFFIDYFRAYAKGTGVTPSPIPVLRMSNNSSQNIELFDIKGCKLFLRPSSTDMSNYLLNRNLPKGLYFIKKGEHNKTEVEPFINP